MQNNLDKYFKENLDHRKFEMKDAYWEQAQKLLDEDERRRRRGIFWWWSGGALGVIVLVGTFFFLLPSEKNNGLTANEIGDKMPELIIENEANSNSEINSGNEVSENEITNNFDDKKSNNEFDLTENNKSYYSEKGNVESEGDLKSKIHSEYEVQEKEKSKLIPDVSRYDEKITGEFSKILNDKAGVADLKNDVNLNLKNNLIVIESENEMEELVDGAGKVLAEVDVPEMIPGLIIFVENDEEEKEQMVENNCSKRNKITLGFSAAQLFQSTPNSDEQSSIAFRGGILVKYNWSEKSNLYLMSGLNYQRRGGTFERSKLAETRNYRFGLELDTNMLRPSSVHTVSLPLLLGHEKGRHVFEVGFSLDYLSGVYGERGGIERIEGNPPKRGFVPIENGWIAEDGFKKLTSTGRFNYRFRVNTQWSFGLSANYTFGGILDNGKADLIGGGVELKEDDKFYLGLQAVYYLR